MTTRQPTELEIQQAEELHRLGLCQGAKEWIAEWTDCTYSESPYSIINLKEKGTKAWLTIGPLATASECIQDYLESIKPTGDLQEAFKKICTYAANQIGRFGYHGGADAAFRQARIELAKEEKCQNG